MYNGVLLILLVIIVLYGNLCIKIEDFILLQRYFQYIDD